MAWNSLGDLAHKNIDNKGIKNKIQYSLILDEANKLVIDFLGKEAKQKVRVLYLKEGVLTIAILADEMVKEFENRKQAFIEMLNDNIGQETVKDVRFMN